MFAIHKGRAVISLYSESPESIVEIGDGPDGDPIVEIGDEDLIVEISDEGGSESEGNETAYTQSLDDNDYEMFADGIEFNDDVVETENRKGSKDGPSQLTIGSGSKIMDVPSQFTRGSGSGTKDVPSQFIMGSGSGTKDAK
ncbi:hypothetical protein RHGRI_013728 [Rhododendron griersonianum]|uniref:Uncharacterized protein n=1 Tax=Rhododendron griersonianum TaxID=479676 RepID=A0AAV6K6L5_9ERIC|nr:hypothetical protein RHGRI_013728 [Rhododendron griersonianum]